MKAPELTGVLSQFLLSKKSGRPTLERLSETKHFSLDMELQETLLNLLGFSAVEFIELLLRSRYKLAQYSSATVRRMK